ncbi:MAG: M16 family metallopeptidase, partial [Bryobacteraceae bacterium]
AYLWHPYGRAVIGNRADIENVPIDKLQAFYRKYYQPDNAVLMVAGRINEAKLLPLIATDFGKIPKPARKLEPSYTIEPTQDGEKQVTLRRTGDTQAVLAAYHIPAGSDPDFPAIDVLVGVLSDNPSGRLHKALIDNKKASDVIGMDMQLYDPGIAVFGAILTKQDSLDEARRIVLDTVENLANEPPSKEEVERAKARMLKDIELQLRNSEQIGLVMSEWESMGDWRLMFLDRDRLRKVTPEDVQRVAKAYLKPSNRTVAEFIPADKPDRAVIPPKVDFEASLKGYKGDPTMAQGEAFDPSPANIESRVQRAKLADGMKVSMLAKKTRGNTVRAVMSLHFGTVDAVNGKSTAASLAWATLMRGTESKNRQQIQDELDRLQAQVRINGSATGASVSIETVRRNLLDVLRLVGEILENPAFPESEFDQIRKARITGQQQSISEPQALAPLALNRVLSPHRKGDPRASLMPDEEIAELSAATVDDAKKFYREFAGGSNGELAIVGDFDPQSTLKLADELFGSWKSPATYERVTDPYQRIAPVDRSIETPDKQNAALFAGVRLHLGNTDPDYPALVLANYMIGGGFLNSRLAVRIRQKEGLSYGIASGLQASPIEKNGLFRIYAIFAPQNADKVVTAMKEELDRAVKDGFTPDEIAAAKSGWLQSQKVDRSEDGALARILAARDYDGRTMNWDADLEKKVGALTGGQIEDALRRDLDVASLSIVKAGDFKK